MATRNDIPTSYEEAIQFLCGKSGRTVCNNTTVERNVPSGYYGVAGTATVRLHGHPIVQFRDDGEIRLDSCGWHTVTTKDRLNRCLGDRGRVFQKNHEWFYRATDGLAVPFRDGLTIGKQRTRPSYQKTGRNTFKFTF